MPWLLLVQRSDGLSKHAGFQSSKLTALRTRRVKCDLSEPSCLRCVATGRTCDGYAGISLSDDPEIGSTRTPTRTSKRAAHKSDQREGHHSHTTIIAKQFYLAPYNFIPQSVGSLMILPMANSTESRAISFFHCISIKHVNEYRPCESWRRTLLASSQTVPSVRHAAIALAMAQQQSLDCHYTSQAYHILCTQDPPLYRALFHHYNRAIRLLLDQESGNGLGGLAVTLLVCYLFTCFEHLMGNSVQALKHLRAGVELSLNINNVAYNNPVDHDTRSSEIHAIICQATRQIRRLDMQAGMTLVDWSPSNFAHTSISQPTVFHNAFVSLDQAADELQMLVTHVMRLRNAEQDMSQISSVSRVSCALKRSVLGRLEKWSSLFDALLQQGIISQPVTGVDPLVPLLRLQCIIAWVLMSSFGPGEEMNYDRFLHQFQQCIALAREVSVAHQRYSGLSKSTFTPELGFLPMLYIIGVKCRHPFLRREVLTILQRQIVRESVWDSISTARVVGRVIEIEETMVGPYQQTWSMPLAQVPIWQRIDLLSFTHVPRCSAFRARIDITYTFCSREGIHVESLE